MIERYRMALLLSSAVAAAFAGPVTTVPWNGHPGAVSFTYDDARTSQLPNLLPQLDSLKLKATFFVASAGTGGDFEQRKPDWIKVAQKGHEIANHTRNHGNVPADPAAAAIITDMAAYLRGLDTSIQATSFAYPNCNVNGKAGVGGESFIARGCGGSKNPWDTQPSDWMNVVGLILTPGGGESGGLAALNAAKTGNSWTVMLSHEVRANPDAYSVTPETNLKLLKAAIDGQLWIDTYSTVGAYYRAHFAMDAVVPAATAAGWTLAWTSPHPKMPKSVKLRVKLASATFGTDIVVQQGGAAIAPEADGSYVIDFMRLSMTVLKRTSALRSRAFFPAVLSAYAARDGIAFRGVIGEPEATVLDVRGKELFRGRVSGGSIPLHEARLQGILFLILRDRASGSSVRAMINATR